MKIPFILDSYGLSWAPVLLAVLLAEVIDLHEINTSHGPVPLKLRVSGVNCGLSGYHRLLNGNYTYQGKAQGLTGSPGMLRVGTEFQCRDVALMSSIMTY